jgi:CRISPR-associated endonuclease Csn1
MRATTHSSDSQRETVWAFDLGKGSIGEGVRRLEDSTFPHIASLLIPPDLARRGPATQSGTPASRYRALKTRQAHHERERWLETVWTAAGLMPLDAREVWENPATRKWELEHKSDYRLEREFAPKRFVKKDGQLVEVKYPDGKASDGAPATTPEDFEICYTSCLLRIKLLRWKEGEPKLAEWQIYKALRSALQRRGYGPVPWATKEARKVGKSPEELRQAEEEKLEQADPRYREAAGRWPNFKRSVPDAFHFPCYYDAFHMGLWNPAEPEKLLPRSDHHARSTRNVRFDRADVRAELVKLGDQAAAMLPQLRDAFARWQREDWKLKHPVTGAELTYPVHAKTFGEFLCDGPAGQPDETSFEAFLSQRRGARVRPGTFEEWMAALGQKTPKFDNRILNDCVIFPRYHVCKVDARLEVGSDGKPTGKPLPESLLANEVTLLLKLKNLLVADAAKGQRKLTVEEMRDIFGYAKRQLKSLPLLTAEGELIKEWPKKVADRFAINKSDWKSIAAEAEFLTRAHALTVPHDGANRPLTSDEAGLLLRAVSGGKKRLARRTARTSEAVAQRRQSRVEEGESRGG